VPEQKQYWFPAKRFGWGWGLPTAWQGWVVLAIFAVLAAAGAIVIVPADRPARFVGYLLVLSALLTFVCWMKGEPPRWRWGRRDGE
jgi:hypothetical protein